MVRGKLINVFYFVKSQFSLLLITPIQYGSTTIWNLHSATSRLLASCLALLSARWAQPALWISLADKPNGLSWVLPFFQLSSMSSLFCLLHQQFHHWRLAFSLKGLVPIKMHIFLWAGTDHVNSYLWFSTRGFIPFSPFGKGERRERTCFRLFWGKEETGCRMRR